MRKEVSLVVISIPLTLAASQPYQQLEELFSLLDTLVPLAQVAEQVKEPFITPLNKNNPVKKTIALVRTQTEQELNYQEQSFLEKRQIITQQALEKLIPSAQKPCTIALCCSGGGMRAAIATLGYLQGAQEIGLLDCVHYISTLSGSTWSVAGWVSSGKDLALYTNQLKQNVTRNIRLSKSSGIFESITPQTELKTFARSLLLKLLFAQKVNVIDFWGALIINNIVHPHQRRQRLKLSEQHTALATGAYPFPLYAVIAPTQEDRYEWFSCSCYELENLRTQRAIPTWAIGRTFSEQASLPYAQQFCPEPSLGYLLGIFSSAFSVSLNALLKQCKSTLQNKHIITSELPNFSFDALSTPMLQLIDAGFDFNIPLAPLLHKGRSIDVIIMLDMSSNLPKNCSLPQAAAYATRHGYLFPCVSTKPTTLTTFLSNKPSMPTVVYIPCLVNCTDDFCSTYNLHYSYQEFDSIFLTAKNFILTHKDNLINAITAHGSKECYEI